MEPINTDNEMFDISQDAKTFSIKVVVSKALFRDAITFGIQDNIIKTISDDFASELEDLFRHVRANELNKTYGV